MTIGLRFDLDSYVLYIPDGHIPDIHALYLDFFDWLHDRPENQAVSPGDRLALKYGAEDFVEYVNAVALKDCHEKAYITGKKPDFRMHILHF